MGNNKYEMFKRQAIKNSQKLESVRDLVKNTSALLERKQWANYAGLQFGGDRDLYDVLGYTQNITFREYYSRYRRQDIAKAIVSKPVETTWRKPPTIYEKDNKESAWTKMVENMVRRLRVYHYWERVDNISGIGRYGVLLLGVMDNEEDLARPMGRVGGPASLKYIKPFHEGSVSIYRYEDNNRSERYGLPLMYKIRMLKGNGGTATELVHWTRVIHIAEGLEEDEVYGTPRLEPVYNRFYDLEKVVGASAETFWMLAGRQMHVNIDPEYSMTDSDKESVEDEVEEFLHKLNRWVYTQGVEIKDLAATPPDPSSAFDVIMTVIAGCTNIPKRILMGSERGELASSQDAEAWYGTIRARQEKHVEPNIVRATIDRLVQHGVLPDADYDVEWENLYERDQKDVAETASKYAAAMKSYNEAAAMGDVLMTPDEFRETGLGLPPERPETQLDLFFDKEGQESKREVESGAGPNPDN